VFGGLVQRPRLGVTPLALLVLAALVIAAVPIAATNHARPGGTSSEGPTAAVAGASFHPAGTASPPLAPIGPIGGRLFAVQNGLPSGTSNSVTGLAVDPATGSVFAADQFAAAITVFNESTGVVEQVQPIATTASGDYPAGVQIDLAHHRLFVSISTRFTVQGTGGWLLVLNESTLATEANISFAAAPEHPFEPTYLAYDGPTGQLFVENATMGIVAIVDLATSSVTKFLQCPQIGCAQHPYGLVDVPSYHTLVVPTCTKALWLVNTSNDSTRALLAGPSNGALMAWTAFDSFDQTMWVENYSYYGSVGTFLGYNLTTLALVADVPGAPPRESGMSYEPLDNLLVTTNVVGSEQIETYNATTGAPVATSGSSSTSGHPFLALTVDPRTGVAIAGGPSNGTTIAFALPSLSIDRIYSSFPLAQTATTTDPADGNLLITSTDPNELRAESEADGATAWVATMATSAQPVGAAYDGLTGSVYVADATSASLFSYDAATGAYESTYSLGTTPPGVCALAIDPVKALIYIGSSAPAEIIVFNITLGTVVGTFILLGYSPCRLAVDTASHELFVLATPGTAGLFVLAPDPGGLMTQRASWLLPPSPLDLAVSPSGTVYLLANSGTELATLTQPDGVITRTLDLSGSPASALAFDPTDGLLFLAAIGTSTVEVVGAAGLALDGTLAAPNTVGPLSFDNASGILVAATAASGQVMIATLVPVPSSPIDLVATPGNDSLSATWGAPVSSGADPVLDYALAARAVSANGTPGLANVTGLTGTVSNLTDGVRYNLTVAAVSAAGASTTRAVANGTPVGIPYPPTLVAVNATGTRSITIDWSAPASDDGAPVFDYVVHYVPTAGGTALTVDAGNTTSIAIAGLTPQTGYSIYVTAENSVGFGHPSATVLASTGTTPSTLSTQLLELGGVAAVVLVVVAVVVLWSRSRRRPTPSTPSDPTGTDEPASETPTEPSVPP